MRRFNRRGFTFIELLMVMVVMGVLAGIGGAYLSIGQSSLFTRNMTADDDGGSYTTRGHRR